MMMPIFIEYNTNAGLLTSVTKKKKTSLRMFRVYIVGNINKGKLLLKKKKGKLNIVHQGKLSINPVGGRRRTTLTWSNQPVTVKLGFVRHYLHSSSYRNTKYD